eukprot:168636-Rhodomonas_salina.1
MRGARRRTGPGADVVTRGPGARPRRLARGCESTGTGTTGVRVELRLPVAVSYRHSDRASDFLAVTATWPRQSHGTQAEYSTTSGNQPEDHDDHDSDSDAKIVIQRLPDLVISSNTELTL